MFMNIEKVKKRAWTLLFTFTEDLIFEKEKYKKFKGGVAHVYVQVFDEENC